jgi:organic hydroperoxide reductase OsmC/OhrA
MSVEVTKPRAAQPLPHTYVASAAGAPEGSVAVSSPGLPGVATAPPPEFGGPGDLWSPETLFCAAIADCYILTFRAVARASALPWKALRCRVEGVLDRADGVTRFTAYTTHATLEIARGGNVEKARELLEKSEHRCLVANSLLGTKSLVADVLEVE